ncbi:tripartite tricarboxylate transporter TctB family protein [Planococcus sp. ISL-109]|uniref:tripartite tricarboxylate transporter TctB family protein n=1 Tax=Planococcus sp. ISL-109 TaxID=2819166 RepID=UPI001BEABA56|nr:tripartite tricarboxylate transporter TctB family protein [Planococcus sp. ISL-109]MBT2583253.1 tripartite tricarboxylate transporter TctB family protein [Planococcus sp. ISL-109]
MGEIVIGLALIALGLVIYFQSTDFPALSEVHLDAGSFPQLVAVLLILLSLLLVIKKVFELMRSKSTGEQPSAGERFREFYWEYRLVILTLLVFLVYIFIIQFIGFVVSTIAFIIFTGLLVGSRAKKDILVISIVSVAVTLGTYFFFENVLNVRFPSGIFF